MPQTSATSGRGEKRVELVEIADVRRLPCHEHVPAVRLTHGVRGGSSMTEHDEQARTDSTPAATPAPAGRHGCCIA